jgi:Ca2+-binding RTX toxin-like protein
MFGLKTLLHPRGNRPSHRKRRPLRLEALETRLVPTVMFDPANGVEHATTAGGPVLGTNAALTPIYTIFWGSYWNTVAGQVYAASIQNSINPIFRDSPYLDGLKQYGVNFHAHVPGGTDEVSDGSDPAANFSITDVRNVAVNGIQKSGLPAPDPSNPGIYVVITAPGAQFSDPGTIGFHSFATVSGKVMNYAWISTDGGIDSTTYILSHEVVEAMTDPHGDAWQVDPRSSTSFNEVADNEAQSYSYRLNGYVVQSYWSQADLAYVVSDGNHQHFIVDRGRLFVEGDQPVNVADDTAVLDTNTRGGVSVTLNGEAASFEPFVIRSVVVNLQGGNNAVRVLNVPQFTPVSVLVGGSDSVTVGGGFGTGIQSDVSISNALNLHLDLTIDDSFDPFDRSVDIKGTSVVGLTTGGVSFDHVSHLTVFGGNGNDTYRVDDTPRAFDPATSGPGFTSLFTGRGNDTVNVFRTTGGLFVDGVTGNDAVDVGGDVATRGRGLGSLLQILGAVHVSNVDGTTSLYVDDGSNTFGDVATLNDGSLLGMTGSGIFWTPTPSANDGVTSLTVWGGNAGNFFTVNNTSAFFDRTRLFTGSGANTVNVSGTTGALDLFVGSGPAATNVFVGGATHGLGSMTNVNGTVTLTNPSGRALVTLDDGIDPTARTAVFTNTAVTGLSPAAIQTGGHLQGLTVFSGFGGAVFNVGAYTSAVPLQLLGGSGADTLVGPAAGATWSVTGADAGQVGTVTFSGVENLVGGAGNDTFRFLAAGQVSGSVDGGAGTNRLDYSADGGQAAAVNLASGSASRIRGGAASGFRNVTALVGSSSGADQLTGANATNLWQLTGANAGRVGAFTFSAVENLTGGSQTDTFQFSPGGSVSGNIVGGGGADWLDYSLLSTPVVANLATAVATGVKGHASGILGVIGGSGADTLTGNAAGNVLIGGPGDDTIRGGPGRSVLIGGLGSDTIVGNSGDDIVIGGRTAFDANEAALLSVLREWQRTDRDYLTRINDLRVGGGLNGTNKLIAGTAPGGTVFDDAATDHLTGGSGLDWFFANQGPSGVVDIITDLNLGGKERVN